MERRKTPTDHTLLPQAASVPFDTPLDSSFGYDLQLLWNAIRRQRVLICLIAMAGVGLTALYLAAETPKYTAEASVLIDRGKPKVFKIGGVLPGLDSDQHVIETQLEILRSPSLAARVLDELSSRGISLPETAPANMFLGWLMKGVGSVSEVSQSFSAWLSSIFMSEPIHAAIQENELAQIARFNKLIATMLSNIKVWRMGRSLIIRLEYVDTNAKRAADIANTYIESYLVDQVEATSKDAQATYALLREQISEVAREVANFEQRMREFLVENDSIKLGELKREAETSKGLYLTLLSRYKEATAQAKLSVPDSRIVDRAFQPSIPSHPKKILLLAASSLVWLGLGVGIALWRGLSRRRFYSASEIESVLSLPCIAKVPIAKTAFGGERDRPSHAPICKGLDAESADKFNQSIFAARWWIESLSDHEPRVVAVVSAKAREGRSTVAAQVARDAAAAGTRTLLVDADLRSAGMTQALGMDSHPGLGDLRSTTDFARLIQNLNQERLDFCPASRGKAVKPLEIFGSQDLENFFSMARENYDLIIVDTPPQSTYVEAIALIDLSDAAIIVVKAADTLQTDTTGLIRELKMSGSPPTGVVMNMTPPEVFQRSLPSPALSSSDLFTTWTRQDKSENRPAFPIRESERKCDSSTVVLGLRRIMAHEIQKPESQIQRSEPEIVDPKSLGGPARRNVGVGGA